MRRDFQALAFSVLSHVAAARSKSLFNLREAGRTVAADATKDLQYGIYKMVLC